MDEVRAYVILNDTIAANNTSGNFSDIFFNTISFLPHLAFKNHFCVIVYAYPVTVYADFRK